MSDLWSRLKKNLTPGLAAMLVVGILLMVMSCETEKTSQTETKASQLGLTQTGKTNEAEEALQSPDDESELISYYEKKLKELLESMEGVGNAQVMLSPDLTGVCILCEGADDPAVRLEITAMLEAVFQIQAHKVEIMKLVADE
jgi:stage III sporulation protein AG